MKTFIILISLLCSQQAVAQFNFKTIAPQKPVIQGESFQVQYVLDDAKKAGVVTAPAFKGFRFVSGPNFYFGNNGNGAVQNIVYTLEAVKPGVFIIHGASVSINGKLMRSNDVQVEVISKDEALDYYNRENTEVASEYFLRPGEDVQKKIRENLFVKVMVDRKQCIVGQPVLATFKLYSRLESKSDIVKNPGFYGFTVHDMVNLGDRLVNTEKINGKNFDVHTIRKVQLYPLRAGEFIVDPMEIKNNVEFSVSSVNKHTEQEIVEGILGNDENDIHPPGTEVYASHSSTEAVKIHVDPLPEKNKPDVFSGAVGHYRVNATVNKKEYLINEQGFLELIISGQGNFIQLDAPSIQWPVGVENFQPRMKDQLDKLSMPLRGSRSFIFPFVAVKPGIHKIEPVKFSFFDPDSNNYRTVSSDTIELNIADQKIEQAVDVKKDNNKKPGLIIIILIVVFVSLFAGFLYLKKKSSKQEQEKYPLVNTAQINEHESLFKIKPGQPGFYAAIHADLWKLLSVKFGIKGSELNKQNLSSLLLAANMPTNLGAGIIDLLNDCEIGMFTNAIPDKEQEEILERAKRLSMELSAVG
jgi:hypothetical protein